MDQGPLNSLMGSALAGVLIVFGVIVVGTLVKAYTDALTRRISTRRIVVDEEPRETDPSALPTVVLIIGVLLLAAWLMS